MWIRFRRQNSTTYKIFLLLRHCMAKEGKRSVQTERCSLQCSPYPASKFFKNKYFLLKASICSKKYTYLWRKSFTCTLMMPLLCIQWNTVTNRYYHLPVYNMVCSCMKKMFSSFLVLCKRQFTCNRCHKIVQHHTCIMFILQFHVCKHLLHTYRK